MAIINGLKPSSRVVWGVLLASLIAFGMAKGLYNHTMISRDEVWTTPFESIVTTVYDLGDGFTATETTTTVTEIISVKHADKRYFSTEQWDAILAGIADGSIAWED